MRRSNRALAGPTLAALPLGACARRGRSADQRKATCDQIAARAVQTNSLEDAKNLTAEASACYARLQAR